MINLSKHFTLEEMIFSQTAARKGINNQPSEAIIENLKIVASILEEIRTLVNRPIQITSGYRSVELNEMIGGASNSKHIYGYAADIYVPKIAPARLAKIIADSDIRFDQLILEYDRWVHIGMAQENLREEILTIRDGTTYMAGLV